MAAKNQALDSLSQVSPNVFYFQTAGTSDIFEVAREKYRNSLSGSLPPTFLAGTGQGKWGLREWVGIAVIVALTALVFYLLLKYKFITI